MFSADLWDWDPEVLGALDVPRACLARIVPTSGACGAWNDVPLVALVGDQQASLVGQGCLSPGDAKVTIGTGAMLDITGGTEPPRRDEGSWRQANGTYPIVAWATATEHRFAAEAIILSAGDAVAWVVDLGLLPNVAAAEDVAASVDTTDGVMFVPALAGLGSPYFDFGARGAFTGLTRGSTRAHLVRAVLEGIAHRIADAVEAAAPGPVLRVDGGAAANGLLLQCVAEFTARAVEKAPVTDATSLGAALWAGVATDVWASPAEAAALWPPAERFEPSGVDRGGDRARWRDAVPAAARWLPDMSDLPL
jgi:glycerol kinase